MPSLRARTNQSIPSPSVSHEIGQNVPKSRAAKYESARNQKTIVNHCRKDEADGNGLQTTEIDICVDQSVQDNNDGKENDKCVCASHIHS